MRLSVVIPTMTGREESLARCLAAYKATSPELTEYVIVKDAAAWPTACNRGYHLASGDIVQLSADDLEPLPGWWEETLDWLDNHDELPAPVVLNHSADGPWDNAIDGPDKAVPEFTRIPIMRRDQWERIGDWPEVNYVADVWVSKRGRTLGIETRMIHSYRFVHHWEQTGRKDGPDEMARARATLEALEAKGWAA